MQGIKLQKMENARVFSYKSEHKNARYKVLNMENQSTKESPCLSN